MFHVKHFYFMINKKTRYADWLSFSNSVYAEHRRRLSMSWKTKSYKDRQSRRCTALNSKRNDIETAYPVFCVWFYIFFDDHRKIGFVFSRLTGEWHIRHNLIHKTAYSRLNRKIQRICNFVQNFMLFYIHFQRFPL